MWHVLGTNHSESVHELSKNALEISRLSEAARELHNLRSRLLHWLINEIGALNAKSTYTEGDTAMDA